MCVTRAVDGASSLPVPPFEGAAELTSKTRIDEIVLRDLHRLGVQPARMCSDEVFVRRAFLDVIGTLPTAIEAREFIEDKSASKRKVLINRLLERDEFSDYWAMKWCDLLRVKSEFPINLWPNAVQAYHRWIRASIKSGQTYDRFARELLTSSGSDFRTPPVNFYRAIQGRDPASIAKAVALSFMGARAERWPKSKWDGMAAFFSQIAYKATGEWKEEIVIHDLAKSAALPSGSLAATFPDGKAVKIPAGKDPRYVFADWLISPANPWFGRNIANRAWSWLFGRGIIHEPDDVRPDNRPSNPELLAYLERELVACRYDLKQLFRVILNSGTYQLSSIQRSTRPEAQAHFASYPLRRLDAEVLIDALNQVTGTTEGYSSAIPEPYTFVPEERRTIALADGSITSPFLELFGRPSRDTGLESERNNKSTAGQRLHLLNSSHIKRKIERGPNLLTLNRIGRKAKETIEDIYLTILSRLPNDEEMQIASARFLPNPASFRDAATDTAWALINSAEFLYRH